MAKQGKVAKTEKYRKKLEHMRVKREALKVIAHNPDADADDRLAAMKKLAKTAKWSTVRDNRRCRISQRPRGNFRRFGMCRHFIRIMAGEAQLPGVRKASW